MHITYEQLATATIEFPNSPFEVEVRDQAGTLLLHCPTAAGRNFDFVRAASLHGHSVADPESVTRMMLHTLNQVLRGAVQGGQLSQAELSSLLDVLDAGLIPVSTHYRGSASVTRVGTGTLLENGKPVFRGELAAVYVSGACVYIGPYTPMQGLDYDLEAQKQGVRVDSVSALQKTVDNALAHLRQSLGG